MKEQNGTKKEKIQGIIIAVLSIIIVIGGAFFASEMKYCDVNEKEVELSEIGMSEFTTLLNGEEASIIYLARPGCTYCQRQEPIVKELISEYNLVFHYLNTDKLTSDEMQSIFSIDEELFGENGEEFGTPTTWIVKEGKIVDSLIGLTQKESFEEFLHNNELID